MNAACVHTTVVFVAISSYCERDRLPALFQIPCYSILYTTHCWFVLQIASDANYTSCWLVSSLMVIPNTVSERTEATVTTSIDQVLIVLVLPVLPSPRQDSVRSFSHLYAPWCAQVCRD